MTAAAIRFLGQWRRAEVLEFLVRRPNRRFTLNLLAKESGIPVSTVWSAVRDLRGVGYVHVERIGRTFAVTLNSDSPATRAFAALDLPTPHELAYRLFVKNLHEKAPAVKCRLFGSVARGEEKPGSDVDVQVAYGGSGLTRDKAMDLCARASNEVLDVCGIIVQALVVPEFVVIR